jgi:hypothetical protein
MRQKLQGEAQSRQEGENNDRTAKGTAKAANYSRDFDVADVACYTFSILSS